MSEIVFLVDAEICSETLGQVAVLAEGVNCSDDLRSKIVVCGTVQEDSVVRRRWPGLVRSGKVSGGKVPVFHVHTGRGVQPLEVLELVRSGVFSGCGLVHCFSVSLMECLGSLGREALWRRWCLSLSSWPGKQMAKRLAKQCRAGVNRIICMTEALRGALVGCGVANEKCLAIQPEPPGEGSIADRSAARALLGLAEDADVLLADSEISFSSNHRELSWAAAIIGLFRPEVRVLVGGCDRGLAALQRLDASLNPPSLGVYPGEKFEPEVLYAAADILVLPATGPVSVLGLLRAGRAGIAVVANSSGWVKEYLRHEHNALLYSANEDEEMAGSNQRIRPLAGAIVRLLEDHELCGRLGRQLGVDIPRHFSSGESVSGHLSVYRQMLAER